MHAWVWWVVQIDDTDVDGLTPLHLAAKAGGVAAVAALAEAGADMNVEDGGGRTPLDLAAQSGDANVLVALLAGGSWWSPSVVTLTNSDAFRVFRFSRDARAYCRAVVSASAGKGTRSGNRVGPRRASRPSAHLLGSFIETCAGDAPGRSGSS